MPEDLGFGMRFDLTTAHHCTVMATTALLNFSFILICFLHDIIITVLPCEKPHY